ncbi:hypothetical protein ScPMuIL_001108 [Solemya velum]
MHPDLSTHLHSDECNKIIQAYSQCHVDNPWKKFLGACNELDREMNACIKREREDRRKANKELAKERLEMVRLRSIEKAKEAQKLKSEGSS